MLRLAAHTPIAYSANKNVKDEDRFIINFILYKQNHKDEDISIINCILYKQNYKITYIKTEYTFIFQAERPVFSFIFQLFQDIVSINPIFLQTAVQSLILCYFCDLVIFQKICGGKIAHQIPMHNTQTGLTILMIYLV